VAEITPLNRAKRNSTSKTPKNPAMIIDLDNSDIDVDDPETLAPPAKQTWEGKNNTIKSSLESQVQLTGWPI
jgi:hypothetical protein